MRIWIEGLRDWERGVGNGVSGGKSNKNVGGDYLDDI
jgi:hypothetical protein